MCVVIDWELRSRSAVLWLKEINSDARKKTPQVNMFTKQGGKMEESSRAF